jgi:predicted transposase/invertase (TIGR01784 family)
MGRRTLQELTIKDNFLFAAVMMDPENCRDVLECTLGFPIEQVEVSYEKSIIYHPEYKGVRLDVFAKDENHSHYDVEMQVVKSEIFKRSRYYHSQMDMECMLTGTEYEELPDSYVIFICDFDPVGLGKYKYTRRQTFYEDASYEYEDGVHTVYLSTKGKNDSEVSKQLVKFLHFVGANLTESTEDFGDSLVRRLQESITRIKASREMGERYMLFEELLKDEYSAGKNEGLAEGRAAGKVEERQNGIIDLLSMKGTVSEELCTKLRACSDAEMLRDLFQAAAQAGSVSAFEAELDNLLK